MDIRIKEFKKIVTSPIIIGLLVLFIVYNSIFIFQNSYFREELRVLTRLVDRFGYEIDDEMLEKYRLYYEEQLVSLNKITKEKTSKNYNSMAEFFADYKYGLEDIYDREELGLIMELGIMEAYYNTIEEIDEVYSSLDIMERAESEINKFQLIDKAAETVRNQYKAFSERFQQLVNNKEHKNLFFLGKVYRLHSILFKSLFKIIIFEIIILVVLITAYIVNYEFDNKTEAITYTTKRGRDLILDKLYVSIFSSLVVTTIILLVTLALYFIIFDYSGLWKVPISSYFNTDHNFPYLSWWKMSFVQFLFFTIGLVYSITLLFNGIIFIIARAIKNTYFAFFVFAIIFGLFLILPRLAPNSSNTIFIGAFTPYFLILNPHVWFMEGGAFATFKYHEIVTLVIWALMIWVLSILSIKRFKRQDI
ncbi:MAG: ABC transporter permease subunit [Tissierellia bacterium]|nr:ABC transporter permease subunit [Tissierellia bacterium]